MWGTIGLAAKVIPWGKIIQLIPWDPPPPPVVRRPSPSQATLRAFGERLDLVESDLKLSTESSQQLALATATNIKGLAAAVQILSSRMIWCLYLSGLSFLISLGTLLVVLVR